MQTNTFKV